MNFKILQEQMDRLTAWRIPGNAVSVYLEGKEVFNYASGYADIDNKTPMTAEHFLNIYSCSKVATVTAALQLYEKGYFLLDDPLYDFIPEYREMYVGEEMKIAKNTVTLRHLFTMTSGMNYDEHTPANKAQELFGEVTTLNYAKCVAKTPLSFEPGSAWQYGLNHDVLGAVIEVVSGQKLRDYMRENIFEPLGMQNTGFHSENLRDRMAKQYHFKTSEQLDEIKMQAGLIGKGDGAVVDSGLGRSDDFGPEYESGGGGLVSSVNEYSKFCAALANGGVGPTGERILSSGTIDLMRTNQLVTPELMKNFSWSQLKGYGYGLGVRTLINKAESGSTGNLGEFGWGGAAGATVLVDPSIKLSMFYAHHMLNPQEEYYQPRIRNALYACL